MSKKTTSIKIFSDGGARGNPGPAACAFVVILGEKVIHQGSKYLGISTNNVAEYNGVLLAMKWLKESKATINIDKVTFYLDSQLVTRQLLGEYKIKNRNLIKLAGNIKSLEYDLPVKINFTAISRENNTMPDSILNNTIDENI